MTGYTVHTGATKKFSSGWDRIFSGEADATADAQETPEAERAAKDVPASADSKAKKKPARSKKK